MKQVKYRLWCNNKKEWEKDEWHLTSDGIIIDTRRNIEMKKETHFLNQFTGLFDKQGVEIYEGDIVKDLRSFFKDARSYSKVFYQEDRGRFVFGGWEIPAGMSHTFEVIGNIYENQELIKEINENR